MANAITKNCEIIAFEENKSPFDMIGFFPSPYLFYGFGICIYICNIIRYMDTDMCG